MNAVLVVALAVPLIGAIATVVAGARAPWLPTVAALTSAAGWIAVASAGVPPELGRITVDPALAASLACLGVLVAIRRDAPTLSLCAGLSGITLFAATAGSGGEGLPDRPAAAGLLAVALLTVLRLRVEGHRRPLPVIALAVGAALVAVGASGSDPASAGLAVVAGAGVVLVATVANPVSGALVVPALLLVVARIVPAAIAADPAVADGLTIAAAAATAVGAALIGWRLRHGTTLYGPAGVAAALASVVLFAVDLPGSRAAGLLLGVGAVAGFVVAHPVGLVALVPGTLAAIETLGAGTEPRHALAGAVLVAAVVAGGIHVPTTELVDPGPVDPGPADPVSSLRWWSVHWPTAAATAFGILPLWGWAGASLDDHVRAVSTAAAFGLPFAVAASALALHRGRSEPTTTETPTPPPAPAVSPAPPVSRAPVSAPALPVDAAADPSDAAPEAASPVLTTVRTRSTGRIRARRSRTATTDGSSHQDLPLEAEGNDDVVEGPPAS